MVALRQAAEGAAQVVELELALDLEVGRRGQRQRAAIGVRDPVVGLERHLFGTPRAPEVVDAGVLGDLIDPGLEGDRALGVPHPPQRGDEHLLGDVLGTAVIADHPEHVGADPLAVAPVPLLEGPVIATANRGHAGLLVARRGSLGHAWRRGHDQIVRQEGLSIPCRERS